MYACLVVQDVTGSKHHCTFANILCFANILIREIWFVALYLALPKSAEPLYLVEAHSKIKSDCIAQT
jgi:hypothetical protein